MKKNVFTLRDRKKIKIKIPRLSPGHKILISKESFPHKISILFLSLGKKKKNYFIFFLYFFYYYCLFLFYFTLNRHLFTSRRQCFPIQLFLAVCSLFSCFVSTIFFHSILSKNKENSVWYCHFMKEESFISYMHDIKLWRIEKYIYILSVRHKKNKIWKKNIAKPKTIHRKLFFLNVMYIFYTP